jgi:hypothetical protein
VDYAFNALQLANPDGSLPTTASGCTVVAGPGATALGNYASALDFGAAGKAQVALPLPKLGHRKFCVRTVVKVDAPVTTRQNLVESAAIPFSLYLDAIAGSTDYKAVAAVAPKSSGWTGAATEFAIHLKTGVWYTLDLIYDTDTLGVAVDGHVQAVCAFPEGAIAPGTAPALFIGTWVDGARNPFHGQMAALQLHDGIPADLEAGLDERRGSPEWFITYKHQQIKATLNLGAPSGGITYDHAIDAYTQLYAAGLIMFHESVGAAFAMHGTIFTTYRALPNKAALGYLISDEGNAGAPNTRKSLFSRGGMYWSGATGAHPVLGQIYLDYELNGAAAWIGVPTAAAHDIAGGQEQIFQGARMYHKAGQPKAHEVHGSILQRFLATGSVGTWGYPVSNEENVRHGQSVLGRSSEFEGCTFYWRSGVGAFEVHGDIREKYRSLNGPLGQLGFPTSDEQNIPGASAPARCNSFEHGIVLWFGSAASMLVINPFKIHVGRIDTQEDEGFAMGQNDLYFRIVVKDGSHQLHNQRYPGSGDFGGHDILDFNHTLPLTLTPGIHSAYTVSFDIWESDSGAPFGEGDDHLGTYNHTLDAANGWGLRDHQGVMNTGHFGKVNSITWAVQPAVDESALTEAQKWWGVKNRGTPELTYRQYGAAFRDVDPDAEWWDLTDWLEKAFYSLVVKGVASSGNCFGMSLEGIYARKHRSLLSMPLDRFTDWNTVVGEFNVKHEYQVGAEAIWWFVGQFLSGNTHDPVDVFRETRNRFARGDSPVVCISQNYDFSGHPHCLMPVAWDDSAKPWKMKLHDPNFPGATHDLLVDPDHNKFSYQGASAAYSGGEWDGGRLHYMPYCVLNEQPRTPIWDAIGLLLSGVIFILGDDAETTSLTDDAGIDLDAFGADAIARLKAKKPLTNKLVSFRGFNGSGPVSGEALLGFQPRSGFTAIQPGKVDARLPANITFGELARANALPAALQPLAADPRRSLALAGRDLKSLAADTRVTTALDPAARAALTTIIGTARAAGKNVRHAVRGKTKGTLLYGIKHRLSEVRLSAPIAAHEAVTLSVDDLGTPSGTVAMQAPNARTVKLEMSSHLGVGRDNVRVMVENLATDAARTVKVNVKPGLGGVDILAASGGGHPEVTIETRINNKVNQYRYTLPFDGGIRIRPSTVVGNGELKVAKIDALFGQLRDSVMVKPKP